MSQNQKLVGMIDYSEAEDGAWGVDVPVSWVSEMFDEWEKQHYKPDGVYSLCVVVGFEDDDDTDKISQCIMHGCGEKVKDKLAKLVTDFLASIGVKFEGCGELNMGQPVMWSSRSLTYEEGENLAKYLSSESNWQ